MKPQPVHQPNDWRERRRFRAWELHQQGWSQTRIAHALGVTQGTVSHWIKRAKVGGLAALRRRKAAVGTPRLTAEQRAQLSNLLEQGPEVWGFHSPVWTREQVAAVIEGVLGVRERRAEREEEERSTDEKLPKTRSEWVYDSLKEKIVSGQYEPLQRLIADQIAREIGTSVIPVREALRRLESEGLVEIQPYVGARVVSLSVEDLAELFEIRKVLEPLLARSAIAGVTPEGLRELTEFCEEMDRALAAGDMLAYSRINFQFHNRIYQMSPWKTLYQIVQSIWERSACSRWVFQLVPHQALESQVEHHQMVEALRSGDAQTLQEVCTKQKERAFQLYLSVVGRKVQRWM